MKASNFLRWSVRDLHRRPGRYILSVVTIGLAVALVLSSTMVSASMQATLDNQRRLIQYADIQVLFGRPAPESIIANMSRIPNVQTAEPRIISFVKLAVPGIGVLSNVPAFGVPSPQQPLVDPIQLSSGSYFQTANENSTILSPQWFYSGSEITLVTSSGPTQLTVKGVGSSPDLGVQNSIAMPLKTLQHLLFNQSVINAAYVRLVNPSTAKTAGDLLVSATAGYAPDLRFTTRSYFWESYQNFFAQYIFAIGLVGTGLGAALLATSTRLKVDRDEYMIGILKSLGMTRRGLTYLFATEGLVFGVSALIIGVFLGYVFLTGLVLVISSAAHVGGYEVIAMDLRTIVTVGALTLGITVGTILLSSYNKIKGPAQSALLARYGASLRSRPGSKLPASFRLTIRYFAGRKVRLVSTGLVVLLATASVLTMVNTLSATEQSLNIIGMALADILVHYSSQTRVNSTMLTLTIPGVRAVEPLGIGDIFLTRGFASNIWGVPLNTQVPRLGTILKEGRTVAADNEVVISSFLADKLQQYLGDQLQFTTGGITTQTLSLTIVGITYFPFPLTFASYNFVSTMILKQDSSYSSDYMLRVTDPSITSQVVSSLQTQLGGYVLVSSGTDQLKSESDRYILPLDLLNLSIAALMIGLTASAVFGMTSVGLLERSKDYAVLKALGATPRRLFGWTIVETLFSSLPFAILGFLGGLALTSYVLAAAENIMLLPFSQWFSLSPLFITGSVGLETGLPLLGVLPLLWTNALRPAGPELKHE
jgi:ABC-type antimicrobial peptide transport system permease subunit